MLFKAKTLIIGCAKKAEHAFFVQAKGAKRQFIGFLVVKLLTVEVVEAETDVFLVMLNSFFLFLFLELQKLNFFANALEMGFILLNDNFKTSIIFNFFS